MMEANILFAWLAGLLAFFSACLLPVVPAFLTYLSGLALAQLKTTPGGQASDIRPVKRLVILNSLAFIFGFSLIFTLLGATASLIGRLLVHYRLLLQQISGLVIILFGLYLIKLINIPWFNRPFSLNVQKHKFNFQLINSFVIGSGFALGWTPCVSPILASLVFLASFSQTMWQGIMLLGFFSLGLALPFFLISLSLDYSLRILPKLNRHLNKIRLLAGALIIIMGVLLLFDKWDSSITYLLNLF